MFDANFGTIEQLMGFAYGSNGCNRKVFSFQGDHIDTARPCRKTFGQHVGRNVLEDARQAAYKAIATDRCKMVNRNAPAQCRIMLYPDMSAEHYRIGHDDTIFYDAIMSDVRVCHEVTLIADRRNAFVFFGASIDSHTFAENV